jgi:hypothetical protein
MAVLPLIPWLCWLEELDKLDLRSAEFCYQINVYN